MRSKLAVALVLVVFVGCKSSGTNQPLASKVPLTAEEALVKQMTATESEQGFSFRNMMASFMRPSGQDSGLVPPQLVQLTATANTVVAQAAELNMNDPPAVTAEKAQKILTALSPWENLLATAKSMGLVTDETAGPLQAVVEQIRLHAGSLIQLGAQPETIAAIQHLAGQLKFAGSGIASMIAS